MALRALAELQQRGDGTGRVFRNLAGVPLRGPRYWFEKAIVAAGILDFHWHDLRHTFASRLAMAKAGLPAIQEALGHKSIAMTARYAHLEPDFMQDVVDRLVPRPTETPDAERTDTGTDTDGSTAITSQVARVH